MREMMIDITVMLRLVGLEIIGSKTSFLSSPHKWKLPGSC